MPAVAQLHLLHHKLLFNSLTATNVYMTKCLHRRPSASQDRTGPMGIHRGWSIPARARPAHVYTCATPTAGPGYYAVTNLSYMLWPAEAGPAPRVSGTPAACASLAHMIQYAVSSNSRHSSCSMPGLLVICRQTDCCCCMARIQQSSRAVDTKGGGVECLQQQCIASKLASAGRCA